MTEIRESIDLGLKALTTQAAACAKLAEIESIDTTNVFDGMISFLTNTIDKGEQEGLDVNFDRLDLETVFPVYLVKELEKARLQYDLNNPAYEDYSDCEEAKAYEDFEYRNYERIVLEFTCKREKDGGSPCLCKVTVIYRHEMVYTIQFVVRLKEGFHISLTGYKMLKAIPFTKDAISIVERAVKLEYV